jgi:Zn-dependent protease/CBS domain-containing protein
MFTTRWHLFRLFGIPVGVDLSWVFILALLTWTMAGMYQNPPEPLAQLYPEGGLGLGPGGYLLLGLVTALAFFACIVLHEMGHALVARANGMPIRGITLFLFGGVAELEGEPPSAGSEFAMAIAGPAVSLVLALACTASAVAGSAAGWAPAAVVGLAYLGSINFAVMVFNLVPAFPLDGGRVLRSALWAATGRLRRATRWASAAGQAFAWLLVFWGGMDLLRGYVFSGLWMALIGLFLNNAARASYEQVLIKQILRGERVGRFMTAEPIVVPPDVDLRTFVEEYVYRHHRKAFPVVSDGRLEGYVTTQMLSRYPRAEWGAHTVADIMERDLRDVTVTPNADALEALGKMQRSGYSRLLVVDGGRLAGIISLKDLLRFLQLKLELDGEDADEPGGSDVPAPGPDRRERAPVREEVGAGPH